MTDQAFLMGEIMALYRKHGWQLKRVLLQPETRTQLQQQGNTQFDNVAVKESTVDALWFSRSSGGGREAWELRLVADTPYALFEIFEADETEAYREDARDDMEARLRVFSGERR